LPTADRDVLAGRISQLTAHLAWVPDPRDPRRVRHSLCSLLAAAVAAALTGATSFAAIGAWIADVPAEVLQTLSVRYDPLSRAYEVLDEATIRDVLERLDASAFTAATGAWLRPHTISATSPTVRTPHKSAPAADPPSWQPSATSPSRS
jgi:hypothetical protein